MAFWQLTRRTPVFRHLWGAPVLGTYDGIEVHLLWYDGDQWWSGVTKARVPKAWAPITPPDLDLLKK